ncbi:MAG TPA: aminotransferase [Haliea salexigens]|uniref:Aminotransferase n=1 Tax=Haliea salexigens TaxID=287487 RepID=A0A3C1KRG4_9GAMM|nr:aminotransferase [Haliea sp.]HAN29299.1 aminotransferase [Haliea salexigens]|tara:strand:- start:11860 stop:13002 length:1143 start_codon:yes stop_codon:yes gene_type:complete
MLESKLPAVGTTIFSHMSALASECGALNLSQGFPDFPAPERLRQALARQALEGHNQYAPMAGLPALREAIAGQLAHHRGVVCDADTEITVLPGATEAIYCAITACVSAGDEVILLDPCYDSYRPAVLLAGGVPVHVPLDPVTFMPNWARIEAAISRRTRMLVINSPHNPTGAALAREDLETLNRLVARHGLLVVSDEVYEYLIYDGRTHHSALQFDALRAATFAVFSFGKTYGVTGWKTGYCVAPPALTAELRKIHQYVCFVAVTPVQQALAEFMRAEPDYPLTLAARYQHKRDLFNRALAGSALRLTPSAGSYFQLLDYAALSDSADVQLCEAWTREVGVASIPVSVFYQQPPAQRLLRFCFAKQDAVLQQAAERLCKI